MIQLVRQGAVGRRRTRPDKKRRIRMLRSLYSGISGMKNHQIRMDVIGNNVANVNTTGYKRSSTSFQDVLYQNVRSARANSGSGTLGGINPSQVGLGVSVANIANDMGTSSMQNTGRELDLAVHGNGWFIVTPDESSDVRYFTREGAFTIDDEGYLVNANGYKVLDTDEKAISFGKGGVATISISVDGTITATDLEGKDISPTNGIGLAMFTNQEGLERVGNNLFKATLASGEPIDEYGEPATGGYGTINSGYLEMSNVDLTDELTSMITTQRGYQANAKTITTSDEMLQILLDLKR